MCSQPHKPSKRPNDPAGTAQSRSENSDDDHRLSRFRSAPRRGIATGTSAPLSGKHVEKLLAAVQRRRDPKTRLSTQLKQPWPDQLALQILMRDVLAALPRLDQLIARPLVIVVEVPDPSFVNPVKNLIEASYFEDPNLAQDGDRIRAEIARQRSYPWPLVVFAREGFKRPVDAGNAELALALALGSPVIGISATPERQLPSDLVKTADLHLRVPPLNAAIVDTVIAEITDAQPQESLSPEICRWLTLDELSIAIRPGSSPTDCQARLQRLANAKAAPIIAAGPKLADLAGGSELRRWGEALARDFESYRSGQLPWTEMDRGALIVGSPGVGKTLMVAALARTCAVPLVVGSLSQWQAAGHLGDLLRVLRSTFEEARRQAPCILFIDEIDSFGDRATFSAAHSNYSTQVVNALLEELDGIAGRDGVVVIGASNQADRIDGAIRRSGRLDRIITVDLPLVEELLGILRFHLGTSLIDADLMPAAIAGRGSSGADVARWVRQAKQVARQGGRPLTLEDVMAAICDSDQALLPEQRRRVAYHEAGHAVAVCLGEVDTVDQVSILSRGATEGSTVVRTGTTTYHGMRRRLSALLAGRATEELVLGEISSGAGGGPESDLGQAAILAAAMEVSLGLSRAGLIWRTSPDPQKLCDLLILDAALATRVSDTLEDAYREARDLVARHRRVIDQVAERLCTDGYIDGDILRQMVQHAGPEGSAPHSDKLDPDESPGEPS